MYTVELQQGQEYADGYNVIGRLPTFFSGLCLAQSFNGCMDRQTDKHKDKVQTGRPQICPSGPFPDLIGYQDEKDESSYSSSSLRKLE